MIFVTSSEIQCMTFVAACPWFAGRNWKLFVNPCIPCSPRASKWFFPGPWVAPSSTLSVETDPRVDPLPSESCTATRKRFETALSISGLDEFANASRILSRRLSYLRSQSVPKRRRKNENESSRHHNNIRECVCSVRQQVVQDLRFRVVRLGRREHRADEGSDE